MQKRVVFTLLFAFLFAGPVCFAEPPLKVFVSILPQKYFVEKVGGDLVNVLVMVEPGANPAIYEPRPRQMVALSKTKIYFAVGVPFEKAWLEKISATNSGMHIVHTEAGIEKRTMKSHYHYEKVAEQHPAEKGSEYRHHGIKDPHVWLSPSLVMIQARNILQTLLAVDPLHRAAYIENYRKFILELVVLDAELLRFFGEKKAGTEFIVFHPAWGYFAQTYGLEQVPIELEGKEPKPEELKRLIGYAQAEGIKVVFVQPQFSSQIAATIAKSIGGQIVFADPLALDWADNLRKVAANFRSALQ
ncbi:MAG: zinc ABC transporter substrate-binding protein [Proteobacteria bacterium]|nr:zinc ABC transporter substrate-binding protein [Pseudomonadota bacterium]